MKSAVKKNESKKAKNEASMEDFKFEYEYEKIIPDLLKKIYPMNMCWNPSQGIQNKKDYLFGIIIGLFLCLVIIRQAVGIPLLFLFILLAGRTIKPIKSYLLIALIMAFKILLISIIVINNSNGLDLATGKIIYQRTVNDIILLFMLFVALTVDNKKGFFHFCIFLFILDLLFNVYTYIYGVTPYGDIPNKRFYDIALRVEGIFRHPFYSILISVAALFVGFLERRKWLILLAIINILINGSERGYLILFFIAIFFPLIHFKVKEKYLNIVSVMMVTIIFGSVYYLANKLTGFMAHQDRISRWAAGFYSILINPFQISSWIRWMPQEFPENLKFYPTIEQSYFQMNAESLYLSQAVNYGMLICLVTIGVYYFFYNRLRSKFIFLISWDAQIALLFSYIIFLDGFFAYSMGAIYITFFYCIFCVVTDSSKLSDVK
ncbi:hypothetical protein AOC10_01675 [Polynucleobacter asymbioticus]|uniref:hypothetical protein n=1 Tax=Polynucleobacter asymbioticus TaxID=576611 RepID=UPI0008FBB7B9|nr:hypothetical protein [Polynucleobacter asymbioticus]APC05327.1 hypothetical protein AOC10_01675 [Polynucleobacter asymbioticus]